MKHFSIVSIIIFSFLLLLQCSSQIYYDLTIKIIPEGAGFVSTDTDEYTPGTSVTLTAVPNTRFVFNHWELGDDTVKKGNPLVIKINGNMTIKAFFSIDKEPPVITLFKGPSETTEKKIDIQLQATDNSGVTGWLVNESPEQPEPDSYGWGVSKPASYYVDKAGQYKLYAWAKDAAKNISKSKSITVAVLDAEAPVITRFYIPPITNKAEITVVLDAMDNFDVSHWLITETETRPESVDPGWKEVKPESYTLTVPGDYVLYAWAKDPSGNISGSFSDEIVFDNSPPWISTFSGPASSGIYTINIDLEGSDDRGIVYWLITDKADIPNVSDTNWILEKPLTYHLPLHGKNFVYAWAKDEAGNISSSRMITVVKYFDGAWTIMIWLDGDNNLEYEAAEDFNEIEKGLLKAQNSDPDIDDNLAIVLQFDRRNGYDYISHDDGPDWTNTRRYLMKAQNNSYANDRFTSQKLEELGEINMGSAAELRSFILYCKRKFPADHYGLILWNHGFGVRKREQGISAQGPFKGVCSDDTEDDILYIGEVKDALTDVTDVEIIGFDACNMGMLEVAYEYRALPAEFGASYMIGTPNVEQIDGWEYNKVIERLKGAGFTDNEGDECCDIENLQANQLVSIIIKEYKDAYYPYANELIIALDLSMVEDVKQKMDDLAPLLENIKGLCETTRGSNSNTVTYNYFDEVYEDTWINTPHFDLYDFIEKLYPKVTDSDTKSAIDNLKTTIDNFIIESWAGSGYTGFKPGENGLGFFFPDGDRYSSRYGSLHYDLQFWYTGEDLYSQSGLYYGNIDFCLTDKDDQVENWKELLDAWFE